MISYTRISYKNILSVGNQPIVIDLSKNQRTLVTGKNGQGKSLMADALCFALYGKAFRKIKKDQLVNSINKRKLEVELDFNIGSVEYKIIRGISPNRFEIYVNGKLKNQEAAAKEYQAYLEQNILGMSEKTFRQIVILGSTSYIPFMKLTAADRRNVVENLLDIQIFSFMNQVLKGRVSSLMNVYRNVEDTLRMSDKSLDLKRDHLDEVRSMTDQRRQDNIYKITELEKLNIVRNQQIIKAKDQVSKLQNILVADTNTTLQNKLAKLRGFQTQIGSNIRKFQKDIKFYNDTDVCPTCSQLIDNNLKNLKIDKNNESILESKNAAIQIITSISEVEVQLQEFTHQLEAINKINRDISNIEFEINHTGSNIDSLNAENKTIGDTTDLSSKEDEIAELAKCVTELKNQRSVLIVEGNQYTILADLIKEGGIKTKIIKNYLPVINTLIRKYLKILDFNINFTFDETFNEIIKARNRDIFSYANFSEGEKLRIDLCLLFTWREIAKLKNSANTNLILFDEIGSNSLDDEGLDAFMRIISAEDGPNVFVISHNATMIDRFTASIVVEKRGHFTMITEQ